MNFQKLDGDEEDLVPQTPVPKPNPVPVEEDDHAALLGDKDIMEEDDDDEG